MARLLVVRMRAGELTRAHVELAAYCGHEGARLVTPEKPWELCDSPPLDTWLKGLRSTAKILPDVQGKGEECYELGQDPLRHSPVCEPHMASLLCPICNGTGHVPYTVPAERYVMALAAVAAARVAWQAQCRCGPPGQGDTLSAEHYEPCQLARNAFSAAEAWLACPCEERLIPWATTMTHRVPLWVPFPPHHDYERNGLAHDYQDCVSIAARLAGEQPVREAICSALIEWALS